MNSDFECIGIYKQPAFKHRLLKNHKIQRKGIEREAERELKKRWKANIKNFKNFATLETTPSTTYHGASAWISASDNLLVQGTQYSLSQIWLQSGPLSELNSIQVGVGFVQVHPRITLGQTIEPSFTGGLDGKDYIAIKVTQ
ncbi:hypothetical protein glysoja_034884 [Glycine soja]|uniref:Uncharacterized protein n=1 Tax=Glycine soja TaxID=3848 RepID=A0A0B2RC80_GLYSO|nr:hypothetical protein glysoja_034884 [Glycine soja]